MPVSKQNISGSLSVSTWHIDGQLVFVFSVARLCLKDKAYTFLFHPLLPKLDPSLSLHHVSDFPCEPDSFTPFLRHVISLREGRSI
jgi:hypothetical protein